MPAIITDDTKKLLIEKIIADTADSDTRYFVGIGKSDTWQTETDTTPLASQVVNSEYHKSIFRSNLQSVALTSDVSFVVKRYNWSSGTIYRAYEGDVSALGNTTANDVGNGQYYVLTENNRVYICLQQGKTATGTVNPSLNNPGNEILPSEGTKKLGDGYVWRFLTILDPAKLNKFSTSNFFPVEKVDSAAPGDFNTIAEQQQLVVQAAAVPGEITGYKIVTAGAGYSASDTPTVIGNGSGADIRISVSPTTGAILAAEVDSNGTGGFSFGSGYNTANVTIQSSTATTPAVIRPVISRNGVGADIRDDLRSTSVMFNSKLSGAAGAGDLLVDQEFRQVGLLRNLKKPNDSDFTDATGSALRRLVVESTSGLAKDMTIQGGSSGAVAIVDEDDSDGAGNKLLLYHQNEKTGFGRFTTSDVSPNPISNVADALDVGSFISDSEGEVNPFSGELIYIDNRAAIQRDAQSTEDVKIIIQL